jgi:alanine-glyoxylate transaminase/serine-glyoxylate transaminase/serine-pyruvate transaminase
MLAGCEMGLKLSALQLASSGVQAAMDHFASQAAPTVLRRAACSERRRPLSGGDKA